VVRFGVNQISNLHGRALSEIAEGDMGTSTVRD